LFIVLFKKYKPLGVGGRTLIASGNNIFSFFRYPYFNLFLLKKQAENALFFHK